MKLLEKAFPLARRELLADAVYRALGLTCRSTFQPPPAAGPEDGKRPSSGRVYRCSGRPGHVGYHGGGGAVWPGSQDTGAHPAEDLLLRTSELVAALGAARDHVQDLTHVILFTAQGAQGSLDLLALLTGEGEPDMERAVALAREWVAVSEHAMVCSGIQAHLKAYEDAKAREAQEGDEAAPENV